MALPIKKRSHILPAIEEALKAAALLSGIPVIPENFSPKSEKAQETALEEIGTVIVPQPILRELLVENTTALIKTKAEIAVWLRQNEKVNAETAKRNHDDTVDAIKLALLALGITPGRPKGVTAPADEFTALIPADVGCVTTAIYFHVELIVSK